MRSPAWSETEPLRAPLPFPVARRLRPIPSAGISGNRSANSRSMWQPTDSQRPGNCLVYPIARSIGARPRPNAFPSSETRCRPRSKPLPVRASAWPAVPPYALVAAALRHSTALWPRNGADTGASPGRSPEPDAPPSAQCSCVHPAAAIPYSNSSQVRADPGALRPRPGRLYMPQSAFPVGLARKLSYPQNNSTRKCCFVTQ